MEQADLKTELMVQVRHRALQHTRTIRCTPLNSPYLYALRLLVLTFMLPMSHDTVVPACPSPRLRQR